jgi:hypothetical protein
MRDEVLANGITINGLPIMMKRPYGYTSDAISTPIIRIASSGALDRS